MSGQLKGKQTPGEWAVDDDNEGTVRVLSDPVIVATLCEHMEDGPALERKFADAHLFAEAGTVANETGLWPRELAEQRAELLEASTDASIALSYIEDIMSNAPIDKIVDGLNISHLAYIGLMDAIRSARAAIAKAKGEQA